MRQSCRANGRRRDLEAARRQGLCCRSGSHRVHHTWRAIIFCCIATQASSDPRSFLVGRWVSCHPGSICFRTLARAHQPFAAKDAPHQLSKNAPRAPTVTSSLDVLLPWPDHQRPWTAPPVRPQGRRRLPLKKRRLPLVDGRSSEFASPPHARPGIGKQPSRPHPF